MRDFEGDLRNFRLAAIGMAACLGLAVVFPAKALTIDAQLVSFDRPNHLSGGAGGIGTFQLLTDVTGTDVDFMGPQFMAQCLEPQEYVSVGNSYRFDVVDLALAPTYRVGGIGELNASWIESVMGGLGFESVEDVAASSDLMRSAIELATFEAGNETTGVFNLQAGSAALWGPGLALEPQIMAALLNDDALQGFGLLNVANLTSGASGDGYVAQDFAIYRVEGTATTVTVVPEPGVPALFGLGLLGMAGFTRWKRG